MAGPLELVGIQAVVQGIAAFERDAANVNRLLDQINRTTVGLGSQSTTAWGLVQSASTAALTAVTTGASLAVGALTALTSATVGAAAGFENNLLKAGVAAGLTAGQVDSLGATIRRVSSDTSVGLTDISNAANQLARSGITITDIQAGVLESTTKLAEASGGELGLSEAAKLVSVAMNAWELSAKDVNAITGTLLGAANSSAIGFTDLSTSFQLSAPLAASLHISFQDLATAIAELGLAGVKGTVAGTALKTMLERLANPTKLASELMSQYGISIQDANGNIVALPEVIRRLEDALGNQAVATHKLTDAQREQIAGSLFGTRAVLDALALADKGTETFDKLAESIRNTNVEEFARQMRQTLIPQLAVLRNQVESFIIQIGTPLEKALSDGVVNINKLIRALDPRIPKAFADALLAIFSIGGGAGLSKQITDAFGPQLGQAINGVLSIIFAVRDALTNELIPAFSILFSSISSGISVTGGLGSIFNSIAAAIKTVSTDVARAIVLFSQLVANIRATTQGSQLLSSAITGLLIAPFVGLALTLLRVAISFSSLGIQLAIISLAFAGIQQIVQRVGATWDGTLNGMLEALNRLPPELTIVVRAVELLAAVIAVRLVQTAVIPAIASMIAFGTSTASTAATILRAAAVVGIFTVGTLGPLITQLGVSILSIGTLSVALVTQIGEMAVYTASWIAATAVIIANEVALIAEVAATLGWGAVLAAVRVGALLPFIAGVGLSVTALAAEIISFAAATAAEIAYGVATGGLITVLGAATGAALAFAGALAADVVGAIGAAIAAAAPFALGLAAIAAIVALVYKAFVDNFGGIRDFVSSVITFIVNRINEFIGVISQIPVVATAIRAISDEFKKVGDTINGVVAVAVPVIQTVEGEIQRYVNIVLNGMPAIDGALAQNASAWQNWAATVGSAVSSLEGPSSNRASALADAFGAAITPSGGGGGGIPSFGSPVPFSTGGGGARAPKATIDELAASYAKLLVGIQGNVAELAKFLAQLEQATPGRINGMVAALQNMKGIISEVAAQYQRVLVVQLAIATVQSDLNVQQANIDNLHLANMQATFGLQTQLLSLTTQRLAVEAQIAAIDAQIAAIDAKELPIKNAIAAIDRQISDAQRIDYGNALAQATINQQELPIKQQLAALATEINRVEDKRVTLLQRQQEILATQNVDRLNAQLNRTNSDLNKAWQTLNVPQILALEAQKNSLTDSITSAQDNLTSIQDTQKATQQANELATIQIELQRVALEKLLQPLDDQLTALQNIKDTQDANTAVIVAGLNIQKQALEDSLKPLEDERRHLEDLKAPLQQQLDAINAQTAAIQNQIDVINAQFALQEQQFEAKKLQDQVELANLQVIKAQEDARYAALVEDYINAAVQSGAFSATEALETIKRLGFWDQSAAAIENIVTKFGDMQAAAKAANDEIARIPRDITVNVHFNTPPLPSFQYGGVVGGPIGSPQLVVAHGGEHFLGVGNKASSTLTMGTRSANGPAVVNNYTVNATYANKQSPASVGMDLRALIAMSKH